MSRRDLIVITGVYSHEISNEIPTWVLLYYFIYYFDNDNQNNLDNDDFIEHGTEEKLYNESNTSLKELGITLFSLKFLQITSEAALDDILKIFNMILPLANKCPKST